MRIDKSLFGVLSAGVLIAALLAVSSCTSSPSATTGAPSSPAVSATTPPPTPTSTTSVPVSPAYDFVTGAARTLPSMVIIEVTYGPGGVPGQPFAQGAAGTGWVVDARGFIVTNDHVVANAQTITVTLPDGRKFTSTGVQSDPQRDLAVVKIAATNLPVASIGNSSGLQLGQMVAAIGNSLDMGIRITGGLVSRLNTTATYSVTGQTNVTLNGLIETDATINPGNSGGVLIDVSGNVVGIVNAGLEGPNSDIEGFGYAIAINDAMPVVNKLISQMP